MKPEDQESEWIDVGTYPTLDEAHERALVALAMGESIRVEHGDQPGEFDLQVEPDAVEKISEEIRQYEVESEIVRIPKIVPSNWAKYPAGWGYYAIWALGLMLVFHFQQTDLSLVERGASSSIALMKDGEWWRPFTALFLHADLGHLLGNLASGALFGMLVSKSIGPLKAWAMILLSGAVGNLITSAVTFPEPFTSIGASTAVFGALAILSALEPAEVQRAIGAGDHAMIARANGVGPKLAQRICNELKDKAGSVATGALGIGGVNRSHPAGGIHADALAALASLGFKPAEASAAVGAADAELGPSATLDALVRLALRKAAK